MAACRVEITNNCHKNPKQAHHAHEEEKMVFGVCVCEDARDQLSNFFLHPRPSPHAAKSARASQAQGSSKKCPLLKKIRAPDGLNCLNSRTNVIYIFSSTQLELAHTHTH